MNQIFNLNDDVDIIKVKCVCNSLNDQVSNGAMCVSFIYID